MYAAYGLRYLFELVNHRGFELDGDGFPTLTYEPHCQIQRGIPATSNGDGPSPIR